VKRDKAGPKDILQLQNYMIELGKECIKGVLIAKGFSKKALQQSTDEIAYFVYSFNSLREKEKYSFEELKSNLQLLPLKEVK